MSDFWVKKLAKASGRPVPPPQVSYQPEHQPQQQTYPRPWWDTTPHQPAQYKQQQTEEYRPQQAQSIKATGRCPHCGSGNYMQVQTHPFEAFRCFECSPMQATAAVQTRGEAVQPTRQVSTENNFNPGHIVAKA